MMKRWELTAIACVAILCTWLVGPSLVQAEEQEQEVRIQVQVAAGEEGETNAKAHAIKRRVLAVAVHAHDDLEEKLEGILKDAGLEGDSLKEAMDKLLKTCKESCSAGASAIRQIQIPQVTVIGPDGKQQKIELHRGGSSLTLGDGTHKELAERIREKVEQALKKSGMEELHLERVRKALENVDQIQGQQIEVFGPHGLRIEAAKALGDNKYMIGLACAPLNDALRSELKLADGQGLVVVNVFDDTPAEEAGVKEGDVLVKVAGKNVTEIQDLVKAVQAAGKDEKKVAVQLIRDGKKQTVQIMPAERESLAISVETEIDDEALENLRKHLPQVGEHGIIFGTTGLGGIGELGPGVIAPWGVSKADDEAIKALKKQVETLSRQVKQLQSELKKLKADKD